MIDVSRELRRIDLPPFWPEMNHEARLARQPIDVREGGFREVSRKQAFAAKCEIVS